MALVLSKDSSFETLNQIDVTAKQGTRPTVIVRPGGLMAAWVKRFCSRADLIAIMEDGESASQPKVVVDRLDLTPGPRLVQRRSPCQRSRSLCNDARWRSARMFRGDEPSMPAPRDPSY